MTPMVQRGRTPGLKPTPGGHRENDACDKPSIDEWIVGTLRDRGSLSLEQVAAPLGQVNWSELFLAIDRLARSGQILLWPSAASDVVLSLNLTERKAPVHRQDVPSSRAYKSKAL
jgi:hypothetical protein